MTAASTRRFVGNVVKLIGRSWEDVSQELEEFLEKVLNQQVGGLPAGFNDLEPSVIGPNTPGSNGLETDGWASASHTHALDLLLGAKGDLLTHTGSAYAKLSLAGAPDGYSLTANAAEPTGLKWVAGSGVRLVPLTTVLLGEPEFVWDDDLNLVMAEEAI